MSEGDEELKKQARESAVFSLVLGAPSAALLSLCSRRAPAAMRNYRSHVKLQSEACWLVDQLYLSTPHSESGVASGAGLVELVLGAAATHGSDADCADAVCAALASLLQHGEWARAAVEQGAVKAVLALTSAHADADRLQTNGICALCYMVEHADWAAVQAKAGAILAAATRGLSAARVAGSGRRTNCIYALVSLLIEDETIEAQIIAAGVFALCINAMGEDQANEMLQNNGCVLIRYLASSSSSSALPSAQLVPAQEAVLRAMDALGDNMVVQREGCRALQALQPLIRRHLCDVVAAAQAKFPDAIDAETMAATIGSIAGALATAEPAPAAAAGAKAARELRKLA